MQHSKVGIVGTHEVENAVSWNEACRLQIMTSLAGHARDYKLYLEDKHQPQHFKCMSDLVKFVYSKKNHSSFNVQN